MPNMKVFIVTIGLWVVFCGHGLSQTVMEGSIGGIGVRLTNTNENLVVNQVFASGPAERAGIKAGSKIISINGLPTETMSPHDAVKLLRGIIGTQVELEVAAADGSVARLSLTREKILRAPVKSKLMEGGLLYPNGIVTLSGQEYEDVKVDDVFTNDRTLELSIVYDKPSGVEAVTTIDVDDLPPEWQNYCKSYKHKPYDFGTAVADQPNPEDAKHLAQLKADALKGDATAQYNLGYCYASGEGAAQDYTEAAKWFRMAANQGDADAQCVMGEIYDDGQGVNQDDYEAIKWYLKAAEQGQAVAQYNLGVLYGSGIGMAKEYSEAVVWYRKAADQGLAAAQLNLGVSYHNGEGVPQDYVEAYSWWSLAAAQGELKAKNYRDNIAQQMTPEQIAQAQELSREFSPHKESSSDNTTAPDSPTASGSGFFITDDGYLITNYHVVKDAKKVRLVTRKGTLAAKVVQADEANDIALLKADGQFESLPISSSRTAQLGNTVATIGFPDPTLQGYSPKLAKGEIASLAGIQDDSRYFQISVPVQPGNSGGALVDERGNVIGIVSAKLDESAALAASGALPENVNYAVKSSLILSFLESVPAVSAKLKTPNSADEKFSDVVKSAQDAAVLVLVY